MATLIVHDIDDAIANALQQRAQRHGHSVEAEHRLILQQILLRPKRQSFVEVLAQMPNVGGDADFERVQQETVREVFN